MAAREAKNAKHIVFLVVIVLLVSLFVVGYIIKDRRGERKIITNGDRAPEFSLPAPDGHVVNLSDFRGKVVMVHFWATWCPPCVDELPTLAMLNQEFTNRDFVMLAVSVDEGGATAVTSFLQRNGLNVPVLLDPDRATAGRYGTFKFPETYVVNREGIVKYKVIGPRDWRDPAAIQALRDLIEAR
ncbi:MAG: peroxiredoxin family protein [Betaproteobacteria bacterium]